MPTDVQSDEGKAFVSYLQAASNFYSGRFTEAENGFASLSETSQPWLKEVSSDMTARTRLNAAQQDAFDEYGTLRQDMRPDTPVKLTRDTPAARQLGSTESGFKGELFSRLNGYQTVIADPKAAREDKAYALLRAINYYGPSGYNGCGGRDVAQPVLNQAKTLYVLQGQISAPRRDRQNVALIAQGMSVSRLPQQDLWIVYRAHTLRWPEGVYTQLLGQVRRWQQVGNAIPGVQTDFDARTRYLQDYVAF